jgi:hypothetical protein
VINPGQNSPSNELAVINPGQNSPSNELAVINPKQGTLYKESAVVYPEEAFEQMYSGISYPTSSQPNAQAASSIPGEPRVAYYTSAGYAPATAGPLTIKKVMHTVEGGKGSGNRIRVDVEITSAKKNKNDDMINDIDIYEIVDESLNIVPPTDDIADLETRINAPDEFQGSTVEEKYESFSDIPLINFKKLSGIDAIGFLKLDLMRDAPLSSANPDIRKKVYASPELEETVKYLQPYLTNDRVFYWSRINGIEVNDSESIDNFKILSKYLSDNYNINWIDISNLSITYPKCQDTMFVFSWEDVPGVDEQKLKKFIEDRYSLNWTGTAKIAKSEDNNSIVVSNQDKNLSLTLNYDKTNATLKISNKRNDTFLALDEEGKLNIYYQMKDVINISNKNDPDQWIQFQIDDIDIEDGEGVAFLNISEGATYYLRFDRSDTNKNIWNISDWNGIMQFHVRSLSSKDRLFYWYYVRPKKSGDFDTESIIRINDEDYKGWPDTIYPLTISIGKSDFRFEVTPILIGPKVYSNSSLWSWLPQKWRTTKIKYLITYTGSASYTYLGKIRVKIDPEKGCKVYYNGTEISSNQTIPLSFIDKNPQSLVTMISYDDTGTFRIPALWIEGKPYIFEKTVLVDNPFTRLYDIMNTYYTIITFFLAVLVKKQLIELYYYIKNWITRRKLYKKLKEKIRFYYDIREWIKRRSVYKKLHILIEEEANSDKGLSEYVQLSFNDQSSWKKQ